MSCWRRLPSLWLFEALFRIAGNGVETPRELAFPFIGGDESANRVLPPALPMKTFPFATRGRHRDGVRLIGGVV